MDMDTDLDFWPIWIWTQEKLSDLYPEKNPRSETLDYWKLLYF